MLGLPKFVLVIIIAYFIFRVNATIIRLNSVSYADFSIVLDGFADTGSILKSFALKTRHQCVLECVSLVTCKSLNFKKVGGNCELLGRTLEESKTHLNTRSGWVYMTTNDADADVSGAS